MASAAAFIGYGLLITYREDIHGGTDYDGVYVKSYDRWSVFPVLLAFVL